MIKLMNLRIGNQFSSFMFIRFMPTLILGIIGFFAIFTDSWQIFFVPTLHPNFADLRSIITNAFCYAEDPNWTYESQPCDPWGRKFNYPTIWLKVLNNTGLINENFTNSIGFVFFILLLGSLAYWNMRIIKRNYFLWQVITLSLIYISPPILLLVERGNTDILIFSTVTFLCAINKKISSIKINTMISILSIFKIYTLGAIFLQYFYERNTKKNVFNTFLVLLTLYFLKNELMYIRNNTGVTYWTSFGISVIPLGISEIFTLNFSPIDSYFLGILITATLLLTVIYLNRLSSNKFNLFGNLTNFKIGNEFPIFLGIIIFSFLMGSSFDYRLIFMVPILQFFFTQPQSNNLNRFFIFSYLISMYVSRLGIYAIIGDFILNLLMVIMVLKFFQFRRFLLNY